jgi:hypothetical protein
MPRSIPGFVLAFIIATSAGCGAMDGAPSADSEQALRLPPPAPLPPLPTPPPFDCDRATRGHTACASREVQVRCIQRTDRTFDWQFERCPVEYQPCATSDAKAGFGSCRNRGIPCSGCSDE